MNGKTRVRVNPRGSQGLSTLDGISDRRSSGAVSVYEEQEYRSKSKLKPGAERSLQPSLTLDYSDTYRENDYLQEELEEQIGYIQKDEKRTLGETSEQLEEIRKQVEAITKLQEAVNAKGSRDSVDILNIGRATRYGQRRNTRLGPGAAGGASKQEVDFFEMAKASRSEQRIAAEREKFSAKNLFNQRRSQTSLGFETKSSKKYFPPAVIIQDDDPLDFVDQATNSEQIQHKSQQEEPFSHDSSYQRSHSASFLNSKPNSFSTNSQQNSLPVSNNNRKPNSAKRAKGYLQGTFSSQGGRPKTAAPTYHRMEKHDELLPPRAKSASNRSRSRRELELLSRILPEEDEVETAKIDIENEWEIFYERRRRKRLQILKEEGDVLQTRVKTFLNDISKYSARGKTLSTPVENFVNSPRRPSMPRAITELN